MPPAPRSARPSRCEAGRASALLAAAVALLAPAGAQGAGFASARFGGELGDVSATNPTALYYNPAGIAWSPGTALYVDGVLAWRRGSYRHDGGPGDHPDPADATGANTGRATFANLFGAPMLGVTTHLGPLAVGAAGYVPFGGRSHWDPNPAFPASSRYPLAGAGVQRWHIIDGALTFFYGSAGAALRLGHLSVGATASVVRSSVSNSQAKNIVGDGAPDTSREGRVVLDVSGTELAFGLGLVWEAAADRLWLAASYQSQPGLGPMHLGGTIRSTYDGGTTAFPVTLRQALPDVTRVGARLRVGTRLQLRAELSLTRWSVLGDQCVAVAGKPCAVRPDGSDATAENSTVLDLRRRWRDSGAAHLGASLDLGSRVQLQVGVGGETAAVPDSTLEPGLMDGDALSVALGARVEIASGLYLQGTATHVQYLDRNNRGGSELWQAQLPTGRPDGGGLYTLALTIFQVAVEKRF